MAQARQAVADWQAGKFTPATPTPGQSTEELVRQLERQLAFQPAPQGLQVNLNEPRVANTDRGTVVSFPATVGSVGGEVRITLRGGQVTRAGFALEGGRLPAWTESPLAWGLFGLFSLLFVYAIFGASRVGQLWREAWALTRQYRGLYIGINVGLYGLFALGSLVAYANPRIVALMQEVVGGALEQIGIGNAFAYGVAGLATTIFYWNFTNGLILTTAVPGLLMGIPALLFNAARYFVLGFALSPVALPLAGYLVHLPTVVVELQAYIFVTFGGMVLMTKVLKGEGYRKGLRALGLTVLVGAFFLVVGAWYEAFSLSLLR
ncbi:MAG: stage II sporulation protein M [Meiothermus sp.]|nr:stage II sporulation protein M [Meiothermus sp.]